jgi:hypothetical protein
MVQGEKAEQRGEWSSGRSCREEIDLQWFSFGLIPISSVTGVSRPAATYEWASRNIWKGCTQGRGFKPRCVQSNICSFEVRRYRRCVGEGAAEVLEGA